ncbi:MAG: hypothetical protein ACO1RT_18845 [Planctomycetaceae bacterium]
MLKVFGLLALGFITAILAGCDSAVAPVADNVQTNSPSPEASDVAAPADAETKSAAITAALAKLSPEDREIAEAQRYCAVLTENPLGSMGTPFKLDVNGEPVFLCCAGCKSKALRDPDATLATVARLKAEHASSP